MTNTLKAKRDIIPYIRENYSSSQIATIFGLSVPTIDRYVKDLRNAGLLPTHRKRGRKSVKL